jgi:hypothetical protein
MNPKRFIILLGLTSFLLSFEEARGADFALGFEGVPERIVGAPGEVKTFDVFLTLTTTNNESPDGAQGWTIFLKIEGGNFMKLSIGGIEVSTIYDEDPDLDPATPPIHHDPYLFDLGNSFTAFASPRGGHGAPCAAEEVIFKAREKMVLQPTGSQRIGKLTIQAEMPGTGNCLPLAIDFEELPGHDFCIPPGEMNFGTVVTWAGESRKPQLESATVLLCPSIFRRGDSNSDSLVDISDAIHLLYALFLGGPPPSCRDAADMNDDTGLDLSDAVFLLGDLFRPEFTTGLPAPGPYACGPDPTVDGLGCEGSPCTAQ